MAALLIATVAGPAVAQTAPDGQLSRTGYGSALAIANGEVIVGEAGFNYNPGIVHVVRRDASGSWSAAEMLTASDAAMYDGFGASIAVDGSVMLIGAPRQDDERGSVYVFEKDGDGTWKETSKLQPPAAIQNFGAALALDGDVALIGSAGGVLGGGSGADATSVYVYRRGAGGWQMEQELKLTDAAEGTAYGTALALDGGMALVGAPNAGFTAIFGRGGGAPGSVYTYRFDAAQKQWMPSDTLVYSRQGGVDGFGTTLLKQGDTIFVGAPFVNGGTGTVAIYGVDQRRGGWRQMGALNPYDGGRRTLFGMGIQFDGTRAIVAAPGAGGFQGAIYSFGGDGESGAWTGSSKVLVPDMAGGDFFGSAVALEGSVAAVSAIRHDSGLGGVAIFTWDDDQGWVQQSLLSGTEESLDPITGGQKTCSDGEISIFDCNRIDLLSFLPIKDIGGSRSTNLNDIWGWTDTQTNREYALVGRTDGTAFVDVTDPVNPRYVGQLPMTEGARSSAWRDIKVYKDHAYIVSDNAGQHGVQIFDLTQLRNVMGDPVTFEPTAMYDKINSAHNIVINTDTGYGFVVGASGGGETCGGGLHMINLADPEKPVFAGCFADPSTGRSGTGYTHDAQCVTYAGPDEDYEGHEICFGANETALSIADVTDKAHPVAVSTADYPNVAYTHQGWLTEDQRYFYLDDELDEQAGTVDGTRTLIWDVSDLEDPQLVGTHIARSMAIDHNLYVKGNYMYQSNYNSGLHILDISNPEKPEEVGFFDTMPVGKDTAEFSGTWSNYPFFKSGTIVVSSIGEGLFVLKKQDVGM